MMSNTNMTTLDSFIDAQKREVKKDTKIAEIISDVINAGIDNT